MMKKLLKSFLDKLYAPLLSRFFALEKSIETGHIIQAKQIVDSWGKRPFSMIRDAEFKVFSQWGEDGIIQYLIGRIPIENRTFVEFGVEDYSESNTRLLLLKDDWRGLVIDGSAEHVKSIKQRDWVWRHHLDAVCSFITAENINGILGDAGFVGDVGLLSIDVDGNDYWLWRAITVIRPRIVVIEYNGLWGVEHELTVPYDPGFVRSAKHYSNLYYGASLPLLCRLAAEKGYSFVGSNSTGINAFFVRNDCMGGLSSQQIVTEYGFRRIREGRSVDGALSFPSRAQQLNLLRDMPLIDFGDGGSSKAVGGLLL